MTSIFKKAKLGLKIGAGFTVVILLLISTAFVSWDGLNYAKNSFTEYRTLARHTNLAGRLQANMLMIRMNVKDYLITNSEKDQQQYDEYYQSMTQFLQEAEREIQKPKLASMIREYAAHVVTYNDAFDEVKKSIRARNETVSQTLVPVGVDMEKNLTDIMASAKEDGDANAAYEAGTALRHMLLARLYAQKFLGSRSKDDEQRVESEFADCRNNLETLMNSLENPERRALNQEVIEHADVYFDAFKTIADSSYQRDDLVKNTLDRLGPVMADIVEDVKLDLKASQDELGPMVQKKVFKANTTGLVVSTIALIASILAAILLTKMITGPVGKVSSFVDQMAGGDFTASIDFDSQDEIGHMVRSLSAMAAALREGFSTIKDGVANMASSTTELSAISTQLEGNADKSRQVSNSVASASEQTSHNMTTVAASVEQMSANLRSVATASEEMTSTIEEIARNTEKGRSVTQTAVEKVNTTSDRMNKLGEAANLIGNITDTIKGISDQTNLLALNATIEAASAGEAGKGFAVVANEIKELSRQTAQATEQISQSISNIQSSTRMSIEEISGIVEVIGEIDQITTMIATAVEEQSNTTAEIAHNVSETSDGVQEVSRNVSEVNAVSADVAKDVNEVNQSATEIASASTQLNASVGELSEFAEKLNEIAARYKV